MLLVALAPELGPRTGAPRFEALWARRLDSRTIGRRLYADWTYDEDRTWRTAHHTLRYRTQKQPG